MTLGGDVFLNTVSSLAATVDFADNGADPDTITRTAGSWLDDGFRNGMLIQVASGGANATTGDEFYKINDVTDAVLTLTAAAELTTETGDAATIIRVAPAVTFDETNWFEDVTIQLEADPDWVPASGTQFNKVFPLEEHTTNRLRGPIVIEGGVTDKDRSLRLAVVLPYESADPPKAISVITDETMQTDTMVVFNDTSVSDDAGELTATNLSGLSMGKDSAIIPAEVVGGSDVIIPAGINYAGLEVLEVLLGSGNDTFDVDTTAVETTAGVAFDHDAGNGFSTITRTDSGNWLDDGFRIGDTITVTGAAGGNDGDYAIAAITSGGTVILLTSGTVLTDAQGSATLIRAGPITVIHGGGNSAVDPAADPTVIGGDTITVTGGGEYAPLIIYGDTSQDGSRYASIPGVVSDRAISFDNAGNDVIDASASTAGVAIFGGGGNDIIFGSQAGDHIAGGSGDDEIHGESGLDHIYGDSGFNTDLSLRLDLASDASDPDKFRQVLTVVTAPGPEDGASSDDLVVGNDTIHGNGGDDVIFGDHGVITQTFETQRFVTTGNVERIETAEVAEGGDDTIFGNAGGDRILGGQGDDDIEGNADNNIIFGDNGFIDFVGLDGDLSDIDRIFSTAPEFGGSDTILTVGGDDIIIGGEDSDTITAGNGDNLVFGDNGQITAAGSGAPQFGSQPITLGLVATIAPNIGGEDTVTTGSGRDLVLGGDEGDTIDVGEGHNIMLGDNGFVDWIDESDAGDSSADIDEIASTQLSMGGSDDITTGDGDDIVIGGANDVDVDELIFVGGGDNVVVGDSGQLLAADRDDVHQFAGHAMTIGVVRTLEGTDGGKDVIDSLTGYDIVLGGDGDDTITVSDLGNLVATDHNIVLGDNGFVDWIDETDALDSSADIDEIASTTTLDAGGVDTINSGFGDDIVIGGRFGDDIDARDGDNVVVGDSGQLLAADRDDVHQFGGQPMTIGVVRTLEDTDGGADTISTLTGYDVVLGGHEGDTITVSDLGNLVATDHNIVLGDNGFVDWIDETDALDSSADIDEIASTTTLDAGGIDTINSGFGDDIVIGGRFGDDIDARDGDNVVVGDSGQLLAADRDDVHQFGGQPMTIGVVRTLEDTDGGADTISTLTGYDVVLGGHEGDTITVSDLGNLVATDHNIVLGDNGFVDWIDETDALDSSADIDEIASTTTLDAGGVDTINSGFGDDIVIGGRFGDDIDVRDGDNVVVGDSGQVLAADRDDVHQFGGPRDDDWRGAHAGGHRRRCGHDFHADRLRRGAGWARGRHHHGERPR